MKRVILESPYAGNVERNLAYAKLCIKDCLLKQEAPIASHLLFTQPGILDDKNSEERKLGIGAGHAWVGIADATVVYLDFGVSSGMIEGIRKAVENGTPVECRFLSQEQITNLKTKYPD